MAGAHRPWTRREFLRGGAGFALTGSLPGCASLLRLGEGPASPAFRHGVASGDPLHDRVVLWTRVTPPPPSPREFRVRWEVARDPGLLQIVARGAVTTHAGRDFTAKIDANGLEPGRAYYYRFDALGHGSPVGRTRTLPAPGQALARARFGVCSCANFPQGHFNAYRSLAERSDLDAVVHLGDYIYEYGRDGYGGDAGLGRDVEPPDEITTLADYRARYACYREDPDLRELHRQHPMIAVWDDHELANNAWRGGAENHQPAREGDWRTRRAAAVRSYFEWMPIREPTGELGRRRTWRAFRFGDLVDLVMLDTRLAGRDAQAAHDDAAALADPRRSLLGAEQEAWLRAALDRSQSDGSAWRVLGQQVMLASLAGPGMRVNPDIWDGYRASRDRLLHGLGADGVGDVVALTGDYHSSWASEIAADPFDPRRYDPATGRGARAVEFVAPAISSAPLGRIPRIQERFAALLDTHPHVRWNELNSNGAIVLDVSRERLQAEWWFQETVTERRVAERFGGGFAVARGASRLVPVDAPSAAPAAPEAAPQA